MYLTLQGQHDHDEEMGNLDMDDDWERTGGMRGGGLGLDVLDDTGINTSHNHDDNVIYPEEFRVCEVRLVNELSQNRDQYVGDEFLALSFCPNYVSLNINRIRACVQLKEGPFANQPGFFIAFSAAIHWGLRVLIRSEVKKKMSEVRQAVNLAEDKHPWILEHLQDFFEKDPFSIPNESGAGGKKRNIQIPRALKTLLSELSENLGCSKSNLALIATLITLSEQKETKKEHSKLMSNAVDMFFKRLEFRTKVARLLLEM